LKRIRILVHKGRTLLYAPACCDHFHQRATLAFRWLQLYQVKAV
jgi:hypothetical protein